MFRDVGKVGGKGAAAADNYPRSYPHPRLYRYIRARFLIWQMERTACLVDSYRSTAHSTDPIAFIHENILNSNGGRETKFAGSLFPPRFRNYTHRFIEKIPILHEMNRKFYPKINSIIHV